MGNSVKINVLSGTHCNRQVSKEILVQVRGRGRERAHLHDSSVGVVEEDLEVLVEVSAVLCNLFLQ